MTEPEQNKPKHNILIVDDDKSMRQLLQVVLKDEYNIYTADGAIRGFDLFKNNSIDVVLLDIRLGDGHGINVLKKMKQHDDKVEIIMITVIKDVRIAVEAMQNGAYDYINKEFDYDEVKILVNKAIQKRTLSGQVQTLRHELQELTQYEYVVGFNPVMNGIEDVVNRIAKTPSSVLITGESGSGKEVVARKLHQLCWEANDADYHPFVSTNIAGIPAELIETTLFGHEKGSFTGAHKTHRGKFELASGGTLFLDEIAELKLELQAKLLRAIQERQIERVGSEVSINVDVRIIAATNQNLAEYVKKGLFREDLYYRLNVIPIHLPPLRERLEDLPNFVKIFLEKACKKLNKKSCEVNSEVMDCFTLYPWQGNIRELENVIERMVALSSSDVLTVDDVPIELRFDIKTQKQSNMSYEEMLKSAMDAFEKRFICSALNRQDWHQINTAEELGIHRKTLEYKIKRLNLQKIIEEKRKLRQKKKS